MLNKSSKWELGFVHCIAKFTISKFVISRFECIPEFFVCIYFMQGDVFCFSNLDEALFETDFVIEAINEELEDKKHLLEREYNYF